MALRIPADESVKFTAQLLMLLRQTQDKAPLVPSSDLPCPLSKNDSEGDEDSEDMILWTIDEAMMKRYQACRRFGLGNSEMNRMMANILGKDVPKDVKVVLTAAGKLYIAYLIETALEVMSDNNDSGPIKQKHIAESQRRLVHEERTFESSSGRDKYLKACRQIFKCSSASRAFNTHDRVLQSKL